MLIVLCILSIAFFIFVVAVDEGEEVGCLVAFGLMIKLVIMAVLLGKIVNGRVIDDKIKLIETQNKEIEEKVELTVKEYMNFEKETLSEFKSDSYIQLANLYPDLKSNELVQNQIKLYQANNKSIIKLKQEKLEISNYKWWVYFGR